MVYWWSSSHPVEVKAGEGTGVAGQGRHHLTAGRRPDDNQPVLSCAGRHQLLTGRQAGPAGGPVAAQPAHLHTWNHKQIIRIDQQSTLFLLLGWSTLPVSGNSGKWGDFEEYRKISTVYELLFVFNF